MRHFRRDDPPTKIGAAYRAWMKFWDEQKAAGVPFFDRVQALEQEIRKSFWFEREWKYLCQECYDTGLVMQWCSGDATCGNNPATNRPRRLPHLPHEFGTPCWCSLGARFKAKARGEDDFTAAGKVSKPQRSFTRVGR